MKEKLHPLIRFYLLLKRIRRYRKGVIIWFAVTVSFLVLGSWNSNLYEYRALQKRGVVVEGYIKQKYSQPYRSVLYAYKVGQQEYTRYTSLDPDYNPKAGSKIEVIYDPQNPNSSCICDTKEEYNHSIQTSLVCAFLPTFIWFCIWASELREQKKKNG